MNKRNINQLKSDYKELENKLQVETEKHKMSYEDLRSLADVSFRRIKKLEAIEKYLRDSLDREIALKNRYNRLLQDKEKECDKLTKDLTEKTNLLEAEIKAHNDLKY